MGALGLELLPLKFDTGVALPVALFTVDDGRLFATDEDEDDDEDGTLLLDMFEFVPRLLADDELATLELEWP